MIQENYLEWLFNWFNKRTSLKEKAFDSNFFVEGWINSFEILELITEMESTFNIHFDDAVFNDPRFSTMRGLAEIMVELKN